MPSGVTGSWMKAPIDKKPIVLFFDGGICEKTSLYAYPIRTIAGMK